MAKVPKFKNPEHTINFGGRIVAPHNITLPLYEEMVAKAPSFADQFDLVEEEEPKEKKAKA